MHEATLEYNADPTEEVKENGMLARHVKTNVIRNRSANSDFWFLLISFNLNT